MRIYEVMMIVRPDVVEDELDKLVTTIEGHIGTAGSAAWTAGARSTRAAVAALLLWRAATAAFGSLLSTFGTLLSAFGAWCGLLRIFVSHCFS